MENSEYSGKNADHSDKNFVFGATETELWIGESMSEFIRTDIDFSGIEFNLAGVTSEGEFYIGTCAPYSSISSSTSSSSLSS